MAVANPNMTHDHEVMRVLELYSGIGGLHYALKESNVTKFEVIGAADINTSANEVYKFNFPNVPILQRNIESISPEELDALSPTLIWMSPPCQPFTRIGLKKDCEDIRTSSFLHVLRILKSVYKKPKYIMVENVKGFEDSETNCLLKQALTENQYTFQDFFLSPNKFGIPNSRLRYFLMAKLQPSQFAFPVVSEIMESVPEKLKIELEVKDLPPIADFLEKESPSYFSNFLLPDAVLSRYANLLDIVHPQDSRSCCFTKGYNHYIEGTGSVLQSNQHIKMSEVFNQTADLPANDPLRLAKLSTLQLRYFTPREVANLMGFPNDFRFPPHFKARQCYRLLGNSLNVKVVSNTLNILTANDDYR